jgi:TupA-like ATPgrasp
MHYRFTEAVLRRAQRWMISWQFRAKLGYDGDFEHPKSYQEKIQFRKIYGNHSFYALVADKYRVRDYVAERVGAERLIPLLGVYDRLQASDFETLPQQFIIKANHGSKWNQIVRDRSALDVGETVRHFNRLRRRRFGWRGGERHYNFIEPKILIEELLQCEGAPPWEYNFFCFNGPVGFDYDYAVERPPDSGAFAVIDSDGRVVLNQDLSAEEMTRYARPSNFHEMLAVATALAADFDFVRVDLYNVNGRVYFGELTCTPWRGYGRIANETVQRRRDDMWHVDAANRRLYSGNVI